MNEPESKALDSRLNEPGTSARGPEGDPSPEDAEDSRLDAGVWRELGDLPPGAIVTEEALARMFGRHPVSIKRAVQRGELPPSARLFGRSIWMAGTILSHLEGRLDAAKEKAEKAARKFRELSP